MSKTKNWVREAHQKGYRVDEDGNAYGPSGNKLKPFLSTRRASYYTVTIKSGVRARKFGIHRLQAFQKFGEAAMEEGIVTRHKNGNPLDNSFENILIGTQRQNSMDRLPEDRRVHASKGNRKHSSELVAEIRKDHATGIPYRKLVSKYGLPKSTLSYYLSRRAKLRSFAEPISSASDSNRDDARLPRSVA